MPTPEKPYQIGIKVTGVTEVGYILIKNGRTGDYRNIKMNSSYEVVSNLTKLTDDGLDSGTHTAYAVEDIILIEAAGNYSGSSKTHTVAAKGGATIKLAGVDISTTNAPLVSIG